MHYTNHSLRLCQIEALHVVKKKIQRLTSRIGSVDSTIRKRYR